MTEKEVPVPIRVRRSAGADRAEQAPAERTVEQPPAEQAPTEHPKSKSEAASAPERPAQDERRLERVEAERRGEPPEEQGLDYWRDRALRLQAQMENFCKRQRRRAREEVAAERERLLNTFLQVVDDLERALEADETNPAQLRQGMQLIHQKMNHLLAQEGVQPIEARGKPFDPAWHDAVGSIPAQRVEVEPDTVVEVVQRGYRLGDRLLRPARTIVAT